MNTDLAFTYDDLGRMSSTQTPLSNSTYTYDENGNLTGKSITTTTGSKSFSYGYDYLNRMAEATSAEGTTTYAYSDIGTLTTKAYPNGITTAYGYDTSKLLSSLEIRRGETPVKSYALQRDDRTKITKVTEDGTAITDYSYDEAGRLIGEDSPHTGNITYTYDGAGNRITKTQGATITYAYNGADEFTSDSEGNAYTYSGRGELTAIDNGDYHLALSWNGKGEMVGATDTDGLSLSFSYDPLGRTHESIVDLELELTRFR